MTTDYYRPTHNVIELGPYPPRGWLPPPRLPPQVAAAIPSAIAALEQSLVPAEHNQIIVMLTELAAVLRLEDAANWELRFRVYAEDLADVPPDILTDACRQWRRQEKFWPVASELIALTDPPLKRRQAVLDRMVEYAMINEATSLQRVAQELKLKQYKFEFTAVPILLSLATEIALKAWQLREGKKEPYHTHDLLELFESLKPSTREMLEERMRKLSPPAVLCLTKHPLRDVLCSHKDAFVRWRYSYETYSGDGAWFGTGEIDRAITAIVEAYHNKPGQ